MVRVTSGCCKCVGVLNPDQETKTPNLSRWLHVEGLVFLFVYQGLEFSTKWSVKDRKCCLTWCSHPHSLLPPWLRAWAASWWICLKSVSSPGSSFAHANAHTVKKKNQIKCSLLRLFNHNKCSSSLAEYSVYLNRAGCEVSMYFNFFVWFVYSCVCLPSASNY